MIPVITPGPDQVWQNRKNGHMYEVMAVAIESTNARTGRRVVVYRRPGEQTTYCRDEGEFIEKFDLRAFGYGV